MTFRNNRQRRAVMRHYKMAKYHDAVLVKTNGDIGIFDKDMKLFGKYNLDTGKVDWL